MYGYHFYFTLNLGWLKIGVHYSYIRDYLYLGCLFHIFLTDMNQTLQISSVVCFPFSLWIWQSSRCDSQLLACWMSKSNINAFFFGRCGKIKLASLKQQQKKATTFLHILFYEWCIALWQFWYLCSSFQTFCLSRYSETRCFLLSCFCNAQDKLKEFSKLIVNWIT